MTGLESKVKEARREWVRAENTQRWDHRVRRPKLPVFDGTDPDGWVFRAECFFDMNLMADDEKLEATVLSMEGEVVAWEDSRRPFRRWAELKEMMLERFQPSQEGTMYEALLALKQEGSVRDYRRQFETKATPLTGGVRRKLRE